MNNRVCKIIYPLDFNPNYIMAHYLQMDELKELLEKSGYKEKFIRKFRMRLKFLAERRQNCFQKKDWFENLKGNTSDVYSMKFKGEKNIRVLFTFFSEKSSDYAILLASFEEKNKKDYIKAIGIAKERLKELIN